MHLEKKRPQPKGGMITLESDNIISRIWAFLYQILVNEMRKILIGQTDRSILFINGHCDYPLENPFLEC